MNPVHTAPMRKQVRIALAMVLLGTVGAIVWWFLAPRSTARPFASGARAGPAQFLEVSAEINTTKWTTAAPGTRKEFHSSFSARCLAGTNRWIIKDNAGSNGRDIWCFTGSNIVKHTVITKEPIAQDLQQVRDWASTKLLGRQPKPRPGPKMPHWREVWTNVFASINGCPPQTMQSLPWLAFCSGHFLEDCGQGNAPALPFLSRTALLR